MLGDTNSKGKLNTRPPQLSGFVCGYNPVVPGSNPMHTIDAVFIYSQYLYCNLHCVEKRTVITQKRQGLANVFFKNQKRPRQIKDAKVQCFTHMVVVLGNLAGMLLNLLNKWLKTTFLFANQVTNNTRLKSTNHGTIFHYFGSFLSLQKFEVILINLFITPILYSLFSITAYDRNGRGAAFNHFQNFLRTFVYRKHLYLVNMKY